MFGRLWGRFYGFACVFIRAQSFAINTFTAFAYAFHATTD